MPYRDRLVETIAEEPEPAGAAVPSFLLQPLIENALESGGSSAGGRIAVTARVEGSELTIAIGNHGRGFDFESTEERGFGLRHTRRRLEALYPGCHRLEHIPATGDGAEIRVRIPLTFAGPSAIAV